MKTKTPEVVTPNQQAMINNLPQLDLSAIALTVRNDWKNVYFGAKPYLDAMSTMSSVKDNYGADSGKSIVIYFLSNAQTWKGPVAKAVKAELKKRCGIK